MPGKKTGRSQVLHQPLKDPQPERTGQWRKAYQENPQATADLCDKIVHNSDEVPSRLLRALGF
jgi:hypothetical protein